MHLFVCVIMFLCQVGPLVSVCLFSRASVQCVRTFFVVLARHFRFHWRIVWFRVVLVGQGLVAVWCCSLAGRVLSDDWMGGGLGLNGWSGCCLDVGVDRMVELVGLSWAAGGG